MSIKGGSTKKGTLPNPSKKTAVPGTGRNRPAKGYDPVTKTWHQREQR
jgi:hypothetical protein